jgi:iron complex outermembrane recepter protein
MKKAALSCSGTILAMMLTASPALAQKQDVEPASGSNAGNDEIIVTAQRREQSLMDVPLSIQAQSGEQLQAKGIDDLTSLQFGTTGYFPDTNNGFVQIYMRGVGNAVFIGADPSVATFIDDVPQIYGIMVDKLPDVQRVEVLKGAQGGLYGRNATGGVVNIITRAPSTDGMHADFIGSFGERDTVKAGAYLNVPLGEHAAWSISAERDSHDAYVKNIAPSVPYSAANFPTGSAFGTPAQTAAFFNQGQRVRDMDYQDFWAVRSKLLLKPTDDLSITFAGSYAKKNDNASGQFVSITPAFNQAALLGLFQAIGVTNVVLPAGFIQGQSGGKWTTSIGTENFSHIRDYSLSGTVVWNGPGVDITSITAYRNMKNESSGDSGTSTVPEVPFEIAFKREYFYQELRAVSNIDGPLRYLAGASYLDNHLQGDSAFYLLSKAISAGGTSVDQKIHNWSIYGELGYDLTDRLSLTVSGRYMQEKNRANFTVPVVSSTRSTQSKFIPSATISYRLPDGGNVYARWARGFKTGGVNILAAPAFFPKPSDGSIFGPETVDTYEAGFKAALFNRAVTVTGAVFYNDYRNLQIDTRPTPAFPAITLALINAKSARTYGAEASINWRVSPALTLGANGGYLNAKYKDFAFSGSTVLSPFDLSGARMPKAPEWQASFNADLDQPITDKWNLAGNVLAAYTGDVLFKYSALPGILPNVSGDPYWIVNARIGVKTSDSRVGLYLVADNLFDKQYYVGADAGTFGNLLGYGQRRIIRGELTFSF